MENSVTLGSLQILGIFVFTNNMYDINVLQKTNFRIFVSPCLIYKCQYSNNNTLACMANSYIMANTRVLVMENIKLVQLNLFNTVDFTVALSKSINANKIHIKHTRRPVI